MKESHKAGQRAEMPKGSQQILEKRSLENAFAPLIPLLQPGMKVLDIGCGTGAITRGIAERVGATGLAVGIDKSEYLIQSGKDRYKDTTNLRLICTELDLYFPAEAFDLIVSARVLQWLSQPEAALSRMIQLLKTGGQVCILDYNHEKIQWNPEVPAMMRTFYDAFLKWRSEAGMNNAIADDLINYFKRAGLVQIEANPYHQEALKGEFGFAESLDIWAAVAETRGKQMQDEGYVTEELRVRAISQYRNWIGQNAERMRMYMYAVQGRKGKEEIPR